MKLPAGGARDRKGIAKAVVDLISVAWLTYSTPILDIGLDDERCTIESNRASGG